MVEVNELVSVTAKMNKVSWNYLILPDIMT